MNSWTPPAELGTTLPRRAKMAMGYIIGFTIILGLSIPVMILLFAVYFSQFENIKHLQERGVKITGEVIDKRITPVKHGKVYHIDYQFNVQGDSNHDQSGSGMVSDVIYGLIKIGYRVPVVYDPMRPDRSVLNIDNSLDHIDSFDTFRALFILVFIVTIPAAIAMILLWFSYRKEKRLVEWGTVASAEVLGEREVRSRNGRVSTLTYQFRDHSGNLIQSERKYVPTKDATDTYSTEERRCIFENLTVLYDPYDSASNILYPPSSVEVRQ
jgi:hypothetical protein